MKCDMRTAVVLFLVGVTGVASDDRNAVKKEIKDVETLVSTFSHEVLDHIKKEKSEEGAKEDGARMKKMEDFEKLCATKMDVILHGNVAKMNQAAEEGTLTKTAAKQHFDEIRQILSSIYVVDLKELHDSKEDNPVMEYFQKVTNGIYKSETEINKLLEN